jgi:hypothetical protein
VDLEPRLGIYLFARGRSRLHLGADEGTLRAALADFDGAVARGYDDADLFAARAKVHALLGNEEAAQADRERPAAAGQDEEADEDEDEDEEGDAEDGADGGAAGPLAHARGSGPLPDGRGSVDG